MRFALKAHKLVFLLLLNNITAAQESSIQKYDSLLSKELAEVVVSASRYGTVGIKTPEAIRVLDGNSVRNFQLRTAPEALSLTPGVFIQKTNHGGGSPFIRGLTGNQALLLLDGIRLSNATVRYGPNQYFNTIDVFGIEKFEVMRGSGSVQYGSDAIGGTIQVFSHDLQLSDEPLWGGSVLSRISTHGMEKSLHGDVRFSNEKAAFRAGVTGRDFGDLIGGDTTGRQIPTGYREFDFDVKGKVALSESSEVTMLLQSVHQSNVPVYHKVVLENYNINRMHPQNRKLAYMRLEQKLNSGILSSLTLTAALQNSEEIRESQRNGSTILRTETDRVRSISFSAEALMKKGKIWSSGSGVELYNDLVRSVRNDSDLADHSTIEKRGLYPDGATMTSIAAFSIHTLDWQRWNITAGARFNAFINTMDDASLGEVKLTPSALVGNIALLRKLGTMSSLFISVNSGFRAPNIDDLGTLGIVDFRYETPDFDLRPEHSLQYQAGYKFTGRKIRGEVYLYRNELYNLIVRNKVPGDTIEGYPVYIKENTERAYIQGLETAWQVELSSTLTFTGSLTHTFGHNITRNEPVRRIPPLFGRTSLDYGKGIWRTGIEWLAAGKQDRLAAGDREDTRIPAGGTPGWNIFNLNAGCSTQRISFNISLLNLFNSDYRFHGSGVNGTGRSALLTVAVYI